MNQKRVKALRRTFIRETGHAPKGAQYQEFEREMFKRNAPPPPASGIFGRFVNRLREAYAKATEKVMITWYQGRVVHHSEFRMFKRAIKRRELGFKRIADPQERHWGTTSRLAPRIGRTFAMPSRRFKRPSVQLQVPGPGAERRLARRIAEALQAAPTSLLAKSLDGFKEVA